jgi:hypothetical protein
MYGIGKDLATVYEKVSKWWQMVSDIRGPDVFGTSLLSNQRSQVMIEVIPALTKSEPCMQGTRRNATRSH